MFIVVEGVDGTGKTLASKLLQQKLQKVLTVKVWWFRAPDGPIRDVLLNRPEDTVIDDWTELLLFIASHRWLLTNRVVPALKAGEVVILDRFTDTTVAYQGAGRGLGVGTVSDLIEHHVFKDFSDLVRPSMTIYMNTTEEVRETRINIRSHLDHMDSLGLEFRRRCHEAMATLCLLKERENKLHFSISNSTSLENLKIQLDIAVEHCRLHFQKNHKFHS